LLRVVPRKGNKKTMLHVKRMPGRVRRGIQNGFQELKKDLKKNAIKSMKKPKHGQTYKVYIGKSGRKLKRGRWHKASRPGETPAILSGALSRSLGYLVKYGISLSFGADTPYARRHELDPRGRRSYLLRTIAENNRNNRVALAGNIEKAVRAWKARIAGGR